MRIGGTALPVFDFDPYWVAVLSVLPGLINLFLFFYSVVKLPRTRLTFSFNTFVLLLSLWQITESLGRTATTAAACEFFVNCSLYILILVPVFGIRFLLRLTGRTMVKATVPYYIFYIAIPVLLGVILINRLYEFVITPSPIFNWNITPQATVATMLYLIWIGLAALGMVVVCWFGYLLPKTKTVDPERMRFIAWGFTIPVIMGIVCEILLPLFTDVQDFPVTNAAVLSFSIASFYTVLRTNILRSIPKHEWKYVLDHMDEGILILNPDLAIRYANKKASRLIACRKSKLGDYNVAGHFADSGIQWNELIPDAPEPLITEFNLQTMHGTSRRVRASVRVFLNRENNKKEVLIFLSDIHNLRKAEELAVVKSQQLSAFLYRTSHDLKNPVVCIEGLLSLYKEGTEAEKVKCMDLIQISNNRIKTILHSMSAVTRFNQHVARTEDVRLLEIIRRIECQLKDKTSPLKIITNINEETILQTDESLLRFVFEELVSNAERFRRPLVQNPSLEISFTSTSGLVSLTFQDNGIGIPEKVTGEVFGIFFRGHEHSGTGMGLFSVKWICDKLGYHISHTRSAEGFTRFTITIPVRENTEVEYDEPKSAMSLRKLSA